MSNILIGIPTLDEANNVTLMVRRLQKLPIKADFLFVDDSSTDGTAETLDQLALSIPTLKVLHRPRGLGIGSAHQDIIAYAYDHKYSTLITLDCDFSHEPEDIPRLLSDKIKAPLVVGSRFMDPSSLEQWNLGRKILTHLGHFLTRTILKLPMDATGAFRLYRLEQIPRSCWAHISAVGYAFFFESLVVLQKAGIGCEEISIHLPKRVYGESKLTLEQAFRSFCILGRVAMRRGPRFSMPNSADGWNRYWKANQVQGRKWYAWAASFYRKIFIVDRLNQTLGRTFPSGAELVHVGCGGGEVDRESSKVFQITGMDLSPEALKIYQANYPQAKTLMEDILQGPLIKPVDGIYSLGLVEHFSTSDIVTILRNMYSSVKPKGRVVLFWPHRNAPSVHFLRWVSGLRNLLGQAEPLHPPEPSLLQNRKMAQTIVEQAGWKIHSFDYGMRDLWIQAAIVLEK